MENHNFNFIGGDLLSKIGASWLVSYLYYSNIDKKHLNWGSVANSNQRARKCNKCVGYHIDWLKEIINMNPNNLSRNTIGLTGFQVVEMAKELLRLFTNASISQLAITANNNNKD